MPDQSRNIRIRANISKTDTEQTLVLLATILTDVWEESIFFLGNLFTIRIQIILRNHYFEVLLSCIDNCGAGRWCAAAAGCVGLPTQPGEDQQATWVCWAACPA